VVELLLSKGEKGNKSDRLGRQPAHLAAWAGHSHVLQVLHSFDQTLLFSPVLVEPQDQGLFDMDISDSWSHNHDLLFNMVCNMH
jgi:ankyrin repeat protein